MARRVARGGAAWRRSVAALPEHLVGAADPGLIVTRDGPSSTRTSAVRSAARQA